MIKFYIQVEDGVGLIFFFLFEKQKKKNKAVFSYGNYVYLHQKLINYIYY